MALGIAKGAAETIQSSVGRMGVNRRDDVRVIQELLNRNLSHLIGFRPTVVSGNCDPQTIALIEQFQQRVVGLARPDGRVDPGGRTLAALNGDRRPSTPAAVADPVLEGNALPPAAAGVLKEILKSAGIARAKVTSVSRTPADQARVMYDNCVGKGAQYNKNMYANAGDRVIDVYTANKDKARAVVIQLMLDKINEIGPGKVSKHISETHYTFDVAPSSIPAEKHKAFRAAIEAHKAVSKLIAPPTDPAFHIEIPKNSPALTQ
jgi:hypothetical protein